jgi:hypothetical protein
MTADEFINVAIAAGQREGVAALDPVQRLIYLIAEAECLCDMEGIDSFLDRYAPEWVSEAAAAFEAVGATEIAAELRTCPTDAPVGDPRLDLLHELIVGRTGYSYDDIRRVVEIRLV